MRQSLKQSILGGMKSDTIRGFPHGNPTLDWSATKNDGQKNAAGGAALREGYKTLNSEEEVCISRVAYIVMLKTKRWNVAYCRVTDCRSRAQGSSCNRLLNLAKSLSESASALNAGFISRAIIASSSISFFNELRKVLRR
jgi:hypothetical protein